jgi:UDP-glucose 4-epimerase
MSAKSKSRRRQSGGGATPAGDQKPDAEGTDAARPDFDRDQRVVAVTGAVGYIGAELIRRMEEDRRYYKVLAIDVRKPAFPLEKTQFHRIDLTLPTADADVAQVLTEEKVDTVVHAAFLGSPTHNSAWAHELESIGTVHVLNACAEARVRKFILSSITAVYGASPSNPNFLGEDHPLRGHESSRFINDKVEAERETQRYARENPDTVVTVLRAAPAIGPRANNYVTRFFSRPVAPVLMGYDPLLQFVHEQDLIDAFKLAVDEDANGAFNIVGDGVLPYSTVLALMGRLPLPVPHFLARPLVSALWATQVIDAPPTFLDFLRYLCIADGSRAKDKLCFRPRYDIRATIQDFLGADPFDSMGQARGASELAAEGGRA